MIMFSDLDSTSLKTLLDFQETIKENEPVNSYDYWTLDEQKLEGIFQHGGCVGAFNPQLVAFSSYVTSGLEEKFSSISNASIQSLDLSSSGYISFILVDHGARGQRLQNRLIERVEDRLTIKKKSQSLLCVHKDNVISKENVELLGYSFFTQITSDSGDYIIDMYKKEL